MADATPDWVLKTLSGPRFASYLASTRGQTAAAVQLYWWNLDISAAFHVPLHCVEVTLRNALHDQLCDLHDRADWWELKHLNSNGLRKIDEACSALDRLGCTRPSADDVVAQLPFGFWVSLLSRTYHQSLWIPALHRAFQGRPVRGQLHGNFDQVLKLRNRIMHFEPIHYRHLAADHQTIYRLLDCISPDLVDELHSHDLVPYTLRRKPLSNGE